MKLQPEPEDYGRRLDVFLAGRFPTFTRSRIQTINAAGAISVDGRAEKDGYRLRGGESIEIDLAPFGPPSPLEPAPIPLQIHYQDADIAVVEKPAGLVVHPGAGTRGATMVHALLFHFGQLSSSGPAERPGIVHRIDKDTSGLLVVARNDLAHVRLSRMFQDRLVQKSYIALVHGKPPKPEGEIDMNIARHTSVRTRMAVRRGAGREAHTSYRTLETFNGYTLLEVRIATGRTHQIRVHLSAIGHPVVGDAVYGAAASARFSKRYGALGRFFLHAAELVFDHPSSGKEMRFHSPLPAELESLLARMRH